MTRFFSSSLFSLLLSSCAVTATVGFVVRPILPKTSHHYAPSFTAERTAISTALESKQLLNDIDRACIMNVGEYCLENECEVDDVDAIINQLMDQYDLWKEKVDDLNGLLHKLENANKEDDRNVNFLTRIIQNVQKVILRQKKVRA